MTESREGVGPNWEHLDSLQVPDSRKAIVNVLKTKPWFQNTPPELQAQLVGLPHEGKENHDGFLDDLSKRPDKMGGVTVRKMVDLPRGNFALIPKFDVVNDKGESYTYEYVSWRYGPESGAKGVVFVRGEDGKTTHFVVLRGDKFATGKKEWDSVGGFIDKNVDGVQTVMQRIDKEIKEELGLPEVKVSEVLDLGTLTVDAGMTNNKPGLFAAFIDAKDASKISSKPINPDTYELRSGAMIFPMNKLAEVVANNGDAFFLSTIARAMCAGAITLEDIDQKSIPKLTPVKA